jgi:hypothetical protein
MTQRLEDAYAEGAYGQRGMRSPYVKPFVKNLDIVETERGKQAYVIETTYHTRDGASGALGSAS